MTIAHVAAETYSVLTRLPAPHRAEAATAAMVLDKRLPSAYVTFDANSYAKALGRLAAAGVSGGATYDGLIALTASEHDLELVSRDSRAARTYRALAISFRLLPSDAPAQVLRLPGSYGASTIFKASRRSYRA